MMLHWNTEALKRPGTCHFTHQPEEGKLQFPSVIFAPWNAGIVLVTAGFQSTFKRNWTLERQTEKGRHCQGQSLAWHAMATSRLIDLYKPPLPPPAAILSHWFRLLSVQNWMTGQDAAVLLLYYSVFPTTAHETLWHFHLMAKIIAIHHIIPINIQICLKPSKWHWNPFVLHSGMKQGILNGTHRLQWTPFKWKKYLQ